MALVNKNRGPEVTNVQIVKPLIALGGSKSVVLITQARAVIKTVEYKAVHPDKKLVISKELNFLISFGGKTERVFVSKGCHLYELPAMVLPIFVAVCFNFNI